MKKNLLIILFLFTCLVNRVNAQWQHSVDTVGAYVAASGTNLFAGRTPNGVYLSTDTGNTWTAVNSGLNGNLVKALGGNGTTVFTMIDTAANGHLVYLSTDTGANWISDGNGMSNANVLLFGFHDTSIYAGTNGTGVFLSTDNGANWTAVNTGLTNLIVRAFTFHGNNIFAGTKVGGVFLSTNQGASWTAVNTGLTSLGITAMATAGNHVYAGTSAGGVFVSTDDGGNWTQVNNGLTGLSIKALATIGNNVFAGADAAGVFVSSDNGATWIPENTGLPSIFPTALVISQGYIFAGLDLNGVYRRPLSEFSICLPNAGTLTTSACVSYTSPSGHYTWTSSGTYSDTLVNAGGCDSVLTINLTVTPVNIGASTTNFTMTASAVGAAYQWLICGAPFSPIAGETNQSYTATANGNYAVIVTENGCSDTSACLNITGVGVFENTFRDKMMLNPNPTKGSFSLDLGYRYSNVNIQITDLTGRLVFSKVFDDAKLVNLKLEEPAGTYLLSVTAENMKATFRLIKE